MAQIEITPGDLARQLKVLPSTVSKWRRGRVPGDLRLARIAGLLGVRTNWLRTGQGERDATEIPIGTLIGVTKDLELASMRRVEAALMRATAAFVPYLVDGPMMPVRDALRIVSAMAVELDVRLPEAGTSGGSGLAGDAAR